jgi:hypothetical protein
MYRSDVTNPLALLLAVSPYQLLLGTLGAIPVA